MIGRTENDVVSKKTITTISIIYGNCWVILYIDLTADSSQGMKLIVSIA